MIRRIKYITQNTYNVYKVAGAQEISSSKNQLVLGVDPEEKGGRQGIPVRNKVFFDVEVMSIRCRNHRTDTACINFTLNFKECKLQ